MEKCLFCESEDIEFTCERCKSSFCVDHMATTERFLCKRHNYTFSRAKAAEHNYRCPIIRDSKCPECESLLMEERLTSGHYYLACSNPKCGWNSYLKTPGLFFPSREKLSREAQRYNLIESYKLCGKKLKHLEGKEVCPKCFLDLLERSSITNFSTIMNSFNISESQMVRFIQKYIEEERIYGIIDSSNQMFYYISEEMREKLLSKFQDKGKIKVQDLAMMLDMNSDNALKLVYNLIRRYKIKGSFSKDKKHYYTQEYITNTLISEINEKGKATLKELANIFQIPVDLTKNFCTNLMRTNEIDAFFADMGNELITESKIKQEIQNYAQQAGLFKLSKLAEKLKIAPELARKNLHAMIKSEKIKGLFTQRREFMTEAYLENKIREISRAYRKMPLRELSNKLGITKSSIEEHLAIMIGRGDIDGYIDMQNRIFVAERVHAPSASSRGQPPSDQEKEIFEEPEEHDDKDKVEVLREYDFVGGQIRFKVVVKNHSKMAINNVKVILDVPSSFKSKEYLINIPVIEAKTSHGVDFYLEPKECGISNIGGTVIYKNAKGKKRTIIIRNKEVQIKCPLVCTSLSSIEDCQLAIQSLPNDARAFMIADLDPRLAFRAAIRALKNFETSSVSSYEGTDSSGAYEGEAWYCSEAKVSGGRIITRILVSENNQSLEVRVWCNNPGQLTGFLAKVIEVLFEQINIIRHIKSEEREKTIDIMAITQNLAEVSDYCMLHWKAQNIRNKLHDTFIRLRKVLGDENPVLDRIEFWLTRLNKYEKEEKISEEDADKLVNDVENFRDVIKRTIKL
ncbi:MAG: PCI domain-containing protein [Promethearchaeia archaeon]